MRGFRKKKPFTFSEIIEVFNLAGIKKYITQLKLEFSELGHT